MIDAVYSILFHTLPHLLLPHETVHTWSKHPFRSPPFHDASMHTTMQIWPVYLPDCLITYLARLDSHRPASSRHSGSQNDPLLAGIGSKGYEVHSSQARPPSRLPAFPPSPKEKRPPPLYDGRRGPGRRGRNKHCLRTVPGNLRYRITLITCIHISSTRACLTHLPAHRTSPSG